MILKEVSERLRSCEIMVTVRNLNHFLKRVMDILGSGLGLVLCLPLILVIVILIKSTMPGPVFFKQERIGKNEKSIHILKFRTMRVDQEAERNLDFSKDQDRITKLGKLLRRSKIDELPQLIHVLLGDMSLVGPRPTIRKQVEIYTTTEMQRLTMKPGMTGLAQVNGNVSLSWKERIQYDLKYIRNFSILLDFKILMKTVAIILLGEEYFKNEIKS